MKLVFLVIAVLINFFNNSLIKSEVKIDSVNNKIENIAKKESINKDKTKMRKIHIVKIGDTLTSIAKLYLRRPKSYYLRIKCKFYKTIRFNK